MLALAIAIALSTRDLVTLADAGRKLEAARSADPFATGPAPAPAVQFVADASITSGDLSGFEGSGSGGYWTYDHDNQVLKVVIETHIVNVAPRPAAGRDNPLGFGPRGIVIAAMATDGVPFTGENAYGAKRVVTVSNWRLDEVESPDLNLEFELVAPPAQAREVVGGLRISISGATLPWSSSDAVRCGSDHIAAEADRPHEINISECVVGARINSISVTSGGRVLKNWEINPDPK